MAAALSPDVVNAFRAYDRNLRWAKAHDEELDRFPEQFVAVADGKIIAAGKAREAVEAKAREHLGAYITFVVKRGLIWIL